MTDKTLDKNGLRAMAEVLRCTHRPLAADFRLTVADAIASLTERVEKAEAALEKIASKFGPKQQEALDRWKGEGTTAALEDPDWVEALVLKTVRDITKAALSTPAPEDTHV